MQAKTWVVSLVAGVLFLGLASGLVAETLKRRVDLTGRQNVSEDEIITALTPVKLRGINTRGLQPGLATIALTVNFAFDSAQLIPEAIPNLRSLGRALQSPQLAPYRIRIEGHTDSIGTQTYNQELSQRRAKTVKAYLVEHFDITPDNLVTAGQGELEPLDDNGSAQGRQRNRRAEFINLGK
jgi:outer membrane protein OmpA-like peptidoglycan-associated protein